MPIVYRGIGDPVMIGKLPKAAQFKVYESRSHGQMMPLIGNHHILFSDRRSVMVIGAEFLIPQPLGV
jgi:hypothetical protein